MYTQNTADALVARIRGAPALGTRVWSSLFGDLPPDPLSPAAFHKPP